MREKRRKGRSRAGDDAELDDAWAAWSGARRGDGARSLWSDATLREVGAEEPTEVMNGMALLAIDRHVSLTGVAPGECSYVDGEDDGGVGYRRWLWRDSESPGGKVE